MLMKKTNLLHPKSGGAEAISASIQVSRQQARAWFGLKMKLPSGLQMTSHLSKAITAKDHRLTIPGKANNTLQQRIHKLANVPMCVFRGMCVCVYTNMYISG